MVWYGAYLKHVTIICIYLLCKPTLTNGSKTKSKNHAFIRPSTTASNGRLMEYLTDEQGIMWLVYEYLYSNATEGSAIRDPVEEVTTKGGVSDRPKKINGTNIKSKASRVFLGKGTFHKGNFWRIEIQDLILVPDSPYDIKGKSILEFCEDTRDPKSSWKKAFLFTAPDNCRCQGVGDLSGATMNYSILITYMPKIVCRGERLKELLPSFNLIHFAFNLISRRYLNFSNPYPMIAPVVALTFTDYHHLHSIVPCNPASVFIMRPYKLGLLTLGWKVWPQSLRSMCLTNPGELSYLQTYVAQTCSLYRTNFKYISINKLGGSLCTCVDFDWPRLLIICDGNHSMSRIVRSFNTLHAYFLKIHYDSRKMDYPENGIKSIRLYLRDLERSKLPTLYLCRFMERVNVSEDGIYDIPMDVIYIEDVEFKSYLPSQRKVVMNVPFHKLCLKSRYEMLTLVSSANIKYVIKGMMAFEGRAKLGMIYGFCLWYWLLRFMIRS